jgi:ParB/RepB/Spo0J family partition protein
MTQLRDLGVGRGPGTIVFDPYQIEELPGYNPRDMESTETQAHIREMADAIKENGNKDFPPITIYQENDKVYVMAGWCRRRAHILAKEEGADVKGILCMNAGKKTPAEMALDVLNSNEGLPLTQLEKAQAVHKLTLYLWTPEEIAKKKGWSVTTVHTLLALLKSPEEIKQLVKENKVSATEAVRQVRKDREKAPARIKDAVEKAGGLRITKKHLTDPKESKLEGIKEVIRTLSDKDFEILNEWMTEEDDRRNP